MRVYIVEIDEPKEQHKASAPVSTPASEADEIKQLRAQVAHLRRIMETGYGFHPYWRCWAPWLAEEPPSKLQK